MDRQKTERHLLNIDGVMDKLKIGRSTAYKWTKSGLLPPQIKIGRSSRWDEQELDLWLEDRPRGSYGGNSTTTD